MAVGGAVAVAPPSVSPFSVAPIATPIEFASFIPGCSRKLAKPLTRFWGTSPRPDLSMISDRTLWPRDDPNLAILPRWQVAPPHNLTLPFADTLVAVRFLGGVSSFSTATSAVCMDSVHGLRSSPPPTGVNLEGVNHEGTWCDLVVRKADGSLHSRFDLVRSRLERYVQNGLDVMIVLDNIPWAFVAGANRSAPCQTYGCQYLPPDHPQEFASWVGTLASYLVGAYGAEWTGRVRWRLGTEANGPRWSDRGRLFDRYIESYRLCARAIRTVLPHAQVGASNWVEIVGHSGDLSPSGSDELQ